LRTAKTAFFCCRVLEELRRPGPEAGVDLSQVLATVQDIACEVSGVRPVLNQLQQSEVHVDLSPVLDSAQEMSRGPAMTTRLSSCLFCAMSSSTRSVSVVLLGLVPWGSSALASSLPFRAPEVRAWLLHREARG